MKQEDPDSNKEKEETKNQNKKGSLTESTIKNSMYNFTGTIISRVGGLIFTIILARLLLPEMYGIYSLVLSIVGIFVTLTDLGMGKTLVRYASEALGQRNKAKASAYVRYLFRFRFYLAIAIVFIIIIFSNLIAVDIFQKPEIRIPLIFACLYLLMKVSFGFFKSILTTLKDLRKVAVMQTVFQISRIGLVVLAIYLLSGDTVLKGVFIALALALFLSSLYVFIKTDKKLFFNKDAKKQSIEKRRVLSYLGFVSLVSLSMTFFGKIDTLMLGRLVSAEYLGFYRAALNLATSAGSLFGFGAVLLPVFTQLSGKRFERGFKKTFKAITLFTVPAVLGVWVLGRYFIYAIYGGEYITATLPFYALALVIFIMPLVALYSTFFEAKEKPKILTKAVGVSLILNIVLNFILIKYLPVWFNKGPEFAILGAGIATVISRGTYLFTIKGKTRKYSGIKGEGKFLIKPLIAGLVMAGFLIWFTFLVDMNWILGGVMIILGGGIYFLVMYLIKGIEKDDIQMMKGIISKKYKDVKKNKRI